jgi:C4-dicarboxylate transporter DctM subunit
VYRDIGMRHVPRVLVDAARVTVMLMFIIANALLFAHVLTTERIPQAITEQIVAMGMKPWQFLLVVNVLLLIAGNFMEPTGIILIMAPILFPTAMRLGIDPVHFGILIDVNMEVGLCHPPVGLNLYVASGISGLGITTLTKAVMPWLLTMLVFLVIVTYWPWLTLVVPRALNML